MAIKIQNPNREEKYAIKALNLRKKFEDLIAVEADEIRGIKCLENLIVLGVQDGH